ncbi:MAG: metallophosphoesterase [Deltaproteobacteria bacterium]|nr:metallophosphoesterase [Deltaproteobacteria bacterium]
MKKYWLIARVVIVLSVIHMGPVVAFADSDVSFFAPPPLSTPSGQTIRFAVFSDPHYYDSALGTTGEAFEAYLNSDRKMIRESEAILKSAISKMLQDNIRFVLVSGDLTKDGELSGHTEFAAYLKDLEDSGIQVYVVPGNHDINNPDAVSYSGATTTSVPSISPDDFARIYDQFGFEQAIARDPNSLSYLVEPVAGLCILAMDSCRYLENVDTPIVGGRFSQETLDWILGQIAWARAGNKQIIGFMHHGVVAHYSMEPLLFADYLVDDWARVSKLFADAGMRMVFTGHYHGQDVVKRSIKTTDAPSFIFDVETGSFVTYPVPYRIVTLSPASYPIPYQPAALNNATSLATIESRFITEIDYDTGGVPFRQYALQYLEDGLLVIAQTILVNDFGLDPVAAQAYAPDVVKAFEANYTGDENPDQETLQTVYSYLRMPDPALKLIGMGLLSLWNDPAPADNNLTIDLRTGAAFPLAVP